MVKYHRTTVDNLVFKHYIFRWKGGYNHTIKGGLEKGLYWQMQLYRGSIVWKGSIMWAAGLEDMDLTVHNDKREDMKD